MAKFESLFSIGDRIFRKTDVIKWANGSVDGMSSYEIARIEISSTNDETEIVYYSTGNSRDAIKEKSAIAEDTARSIAIQHLSTRLNKVASVEFPSDKDK
jgi:hypothetical protein